DYNFACGFAGSCIVSGATTLIAGSNTVTLTPVPLGVNGTDIQHYIWIITASGDTTPSEPVQITGGTAVSGASSGTITFTAAYPHITNYGITSATTGIQEAANTIPNPGATLKLV